MADDMSSEFVTIQVHEFMIFDIEDPVSYAAGPLFEWQNTESGKWIMENSVETPYWYRSVGDNNFGYKFMIMAKLTEQDATFYKLKWG
jgi:hypothetical protein